MAADNKLSHYKKRRNFSLSPEPASNIVRTSKKNKHPIFVIQKHNASHLHYDFRIEMSGVLKSWAVPKGPSLNPNTKRLAVLTEDHPIDYATFEGNIPEGHYGAGEVIVWDNGTFENIKKKNGKIISLSQCFKDGHLELQLNGKKLQGAFSLVRISDKKNWLLIKIHDSYADNKKDPVKNNPQSVISDKTIESLQSDKLYKRKLAKKRKAKKSKNNNATTIRIGTHDIELTNQDKLLFGTSNILKQDLINYYVDIAPIMMPYVKNRLISMQRFPQGVNKEIFFQKDASSYFPHWITRFSLKKQTRGMVHYVVIDKPATLIYLANQVTVPHIWLSRFDNIEKPDRIIFDLDPADELSFSDVQYAARIVKKVLDDCDLPSLYMLTGSRGAHVVVPLKRRYTFDEVRDCAHKIAELVVQKDPTRLTIDIHKSQRGRRVFIDWLRNSYGATAVAPYAVRALPGAPIAMPVTWQELCKKGMSSQKYTIKNVRKRINAVGDIWHDMQKSAVSLSELKKRKI